MARRDPLDADAGRPRRHDRRHLLGPRRALAALTLALVAPAASAQEAVDEAVRALRSGEPGAAEQALPVVEAWVATSGAQLAALCPDLSGLEPEAARYLTALGALYEAGTSDETLLLGEIEHLEPVAAALGNDDLALEAYQFLGRYLVANGHLPTARDLLEGALRRYQSWIYEPSLHLTLVRIAYLQGRWTDALDRIERLLSGEARVLYDDREPDGEAQRVIIGFHRRVRGQLWAERIRVELELGLHDRAEHSLAVAQELARETGDPLLDLDVRLSRAAIDNLAWRHELALERLAEVEEGDLDRDNLGRLLSFRGIAEAQLEKLDPQRPRTAKETLIRALGMLQVESDRFEAQRWLADLLLSRGKSEEARVWIESARETMDRWEAANERTRSELGAALLTLESRLALASDPSRDELMALAGSLWEALGELISSWRQAPERIEGTGFLEVDSRRSIVGELSRVLPLLHGEREGTERAFEALLRVRTMSGLVRGRIEPPSLEDVRRELIGPDAGLIVYLPASFSTTCFLVDSNGIERVMLDPEEEIRPRVERWARATSSLEASDPASSLASSALEEWQSAGEDVSKSLLPPRVRSRLAVWKGVSIAGGDLLGNVPFEALPLQGGLLGEEIPVASLPSVTAALWLSRRAAAEGAGVSPSGRPGVLLYGTLEPSVQLHGRTRRLSGRSLEEADFAPVLDAYGKDRVTLRLGNDAIARDLSREALSHYAVLQILAHGVNDPFRERSAGIVLHAADEDGVLWADDAERLGFRGLVVLPSCGAANGPRRPGNDEIANLAGAFLRGGATTVVATRGRLELQATLKLLGIFHRRVSRGSSPARAMQVARHEIAARFPERAEEVARMQVIGLGHRAVR